MPEQQTTVEFVLAGKAKGRPVTPGGIPFAMFSEFNRDVEEFILGAEKSRALQEVEVSIHEGSYLLRALIPSGIFGGLLADLKLLQSPDVLAEVEPKRAAIVEKWQERTRYDDSLTFSVRNPGGDLAPIVVSNQTNFRRATDEQWLAIERYLVGEITDWGGARDVNIHLRLRDTRKIVRIDATADQIRTQKENLVLHRAIVHVRGEQNLRTGELRNFRLLELRPYAPKLDVNVMEQFLTEGAKAWAQVESAAAWVEEQRGGSTDG